jgi:hypothetical protein
MAESVADKFRMTAMTNDAVELLAQTAPVAHSAAAARYAAVQTLTAHLTRIVESSEDELSSVRHPSIGDLGPWREQAARLRAEAEQARAEVAAQAEAIEEGAANQTPTDNGQPTGEPWALQHASAPFEWALAETNARAISRRDADAELRAFDDGLGRPQGRPSSDSDAELRDAPADGDLGGLFLAPLIRRVGEYLMSKHLAKTLKSGQGSRQLPKGVFPRRAIRVIPATDMKSKGSEGRSSVLYVRVESPGIRDAVPGSGNVVDRRIIGPDVDMVQMRVHSFAGRPNT